MNKAIALVGVLLMSLQVQADILKDFDSLGGNIDLLEKAKALAPNKTVKLVQKRIVDRESRHEIVSLGKKAFSGNTYLSTTATSLGYYYHINPTWAVSVQYTTYFNSLTSEGRSLIKRGDELLSKDPVLDFVPELNYPVNSVKALVNWYPVYGKINLYDWAITQFDMYVIGGLESSTYQKTKTLDYVTGIGLGFWLSQHISARFELGYKLRKDVGLRGKKESYSSMNGTFGVGYLL